MKPFLQTMAGGLVGGVIAGIVLTAVGLPRARLGAAEVAFVLAGLLPMMMVAVAIHEAGHLVAGAAVGFKPYVFIVGPMKLERRDRRWRIGFNRSISLFGGLSAGIPNDTRDLRKRLIFLVAGGPAASAIGGIAVAVVLIVSGVGKTRGPLDGLAASWFFLLLAFSLLSLLIAFIALVPGKKAGYSSDGAQILRFMKGGPQVEADVALTAIALSSIAGRRPRDWDQGLLAQAMTSSLEWGRRAAAHVLAHLHALDRQDIAAAREHLQSAIANLNDVPMMSRAGIQLQAAQFAALYDGDARAARAALEGARGGALVSSSEQFFTQAAVLHVEGGAGVEALLDKAEASLPDAIDRGSTRLRRDQIAALRAARRPGGPAPGS